MARRTTKAYDAPGAYAKLIGPRYAPIARALVDAAALRADDDVLEVGAGTGLVTKLAAPRVRFLPQWTPHRRCSTAPGALRGVTRMCGSPWWTTTRRCSFSTPRSTRS